MAFASPAKDYAESELSLDALCIKHRASTFFMRADRNYPRFGIVADAVLVVERSRRPADGSIVIAEIEGSFGVCMMQLTPYPALKSLETLGVIKKLSVDEAGDGSEIFGVVTYTVNNMLSFEFDDVPV